MQPAACSTIQEAETHVETPCCQHGAPAVEHRTGCSSVPRLAHWLPMRAPDQARYVSSDTGQRLSHRSKRPSLRGLCEDKGDQRLLLSGLHRTYSWQRP